MNINPLDAVKRVTQEREAEAYNKLYDICDSVAEWTQHEFRLTTDQRIDFHTCLMSLLQSGTGEELLQNWTRAWAMHRHFVESQPDYVSQQELLERAAQLLEQEVPKEHEIYSTVLDTQTGEKTVKCWADCQRCGWEQAAQGLVGEIRKQEGEKP